MAIKALTPLEADRNGFYTHMIMTLEKLHQRCLELNKNMSFLIRAGFFAGFTWKWTEKVKVERNGPVSTHL